jgi:hypothetical protein
MDIDNKLNNDLKITGIVNNVFRPKKTRIKLYNTLALPPWTDHKTNTEIAKELNITPVLEKLQDYKRKCHVTDYPD